ncbi:MAG TPA: hypothetical protein DIS78_10445 [Lachnospiraceae bacterium]|nr:hypothetical protein [Lachnospiraceae bacterium]
MTAQVKIILIAFDNLPLIEIPLFILNVRHLCLYADFFFTSLDNTGDDKAYSQKKDVTIPMYRNIPIQKLYTTHLRKLPVLYPCSLPVYPREIN